MLIRFIVKNLHSFKEETEFNLLPGKTKRLEHHKYSRNGIPILKQTAIYGANGAGKSNLVKAVYYLKMLMITGIIPSPLTTQKFKLSKACLTQPVELAIEFTCEETIYFYSVAVQNGIIAEEYFGETGIKKDILIFERSESEIKFSEKFEKDDKNKTLKSIIENSLLKPQQPLFFLLNEIREDAFADIHTAFNWVANKLVLISPFTIPNGSFVQNIDIFEEYRSFAQELLKSFNTGIAELKVTRTSFEDYFGEDGNEEAEKIKEELLNKPGSVKALSKDGRTKRVALVNEENKIVVKELLLVHNDDNGKVIDFLFHEESDGTKRLLDFVPAIHQLLNLDCTFIIDEMERSLHPTIIKELISKFSSDENTKGQLIFTTHESYLLDQDIFRTDEIWFAEKNSVGATKLYSLSDFKEHSTIDIRKGYLTGRYGAIPFLGNLHDLKWNNI